MSASSRLPLRSSGTADRPLVMILETPSLRSSRFRITTADAIAAGLLCSPERGASGPARAVTPDLPAERRRVG